MEALWCDYMNLFQSAIVQEIRTQSAHHFHRLWVLFHSECSIFEHFCLNRSKQGDRKGLDLGWDSSRQRLSHPHSYYPIVTQCTCQDHSTSELLACPFCLISSSLNPSYYYQRHHYGWRVHISCTVQYLKYIMYLSAACTQVRESYQALKGHLRGPTHSCDPAVIQQFCGVLLEIFESYKSNDR